MAMTVFVVLVVLAVAVESLLLKPRQSGRRTAPPGTTHEDPVIALRSSLDSIRRYAELLAARAHQFDGDDARMIHAIEQQAHRLTDLANRLAA